ncbi:MAG: F0F1 ATP synthase subunit B [Deltaproteobacteria bacterium]|nr:F0F1 ATP synthase subunit B [Deltaproteobacteria bacterium]
MYDLIIQTINFAMLVGLLFYFMKRPAVEAVASRQAMIRREVEDARIQKLEAEKKFNEFEVRLRSLETEAKEIVEKARADAKQIQSRVIETAKASAAQIVRDAEQSSKIALEDSRNEIHREVVDRAIEVAEKMIRERLSAEDQRRILTEYVGKVE